MQPGRSASGVSPRFRSSTRALTRSRRTSAVGTFDPRTGQWLVNTGGPGAQDLGFPYGLGGWLPVVGDWDGDGVDGVGVVDPSTGMWHLRNHPSAGGPDVIPFEF